MLIRPDLFLPSVARAPPRHPSQEVDSSPFHGSAFIRQPHLRRFGPQEARAYPESGLFKDRECPNPPALLLEVRGDSPRRVYLSHPLWLENRVATSLGSGTGLSKMCVTSQVHGLGPLAQNVLRLGVLTG